MCFARLQFIYRHPPTSEGGSRTQRAPTLCLSVYVVCLSVYVVCLVYPSLHASYSLLAHSTTSGGSSPASWGFFA